MINMINEEYNPYIDDCFNEGATDFGGMSLTEATYTAIGNIDEMMNDLQMSIVLYEYNYLAENGSEIIYEESEEGRGRFKKFIDKIKAAIAKFIQNIKGLANRAIDRIKVTVTSITNKMGVSKKDFAQYAHSSGVNVEYTPLASKIVGFSTDPLSLTYHDPVLNAVSNWSSSTDSEKVESADTIKATIIRKFTSQDAKYYTVDRVSKVIFDGAKEIGAKIIKENKEAEKDANANLKEAQKANPENMADIIASYKNAMKRNTIAMSALLSVYSQYAISCNAVARYYIGEGRKNAAYNSEDMKAGAKLIRRGDRDEKAAGTRLERKSEFGDKNMSRAQRAAEAENKRRGVAANINKKLAPAKEKLNNAKEKLHFNKKK